MNGISPAAISLRVGEEASVLAGGVVLRMGMGEGAYGVYKVVYGQDQIVGVKIVFIKS